MNFLRKPIVPVSATLLIVIVSLFSCKFSFADMKRPEKGSITFGAEKSPDLNTTPEFQSFKTVFADVAAKVIPLVVLVVSTKVDTILYRNPFDQFFGFGSPFDEFFGNPDQEQQPQRPHRRGTPQQQQQQGQRQLVPRSGLGSGVIVSKEGYILTNYHVVGDADQITVTLSDERKFDAEIVGVDSLADVAVIKLKEKVANLPVIYIGDSDKMRPGDWTMAVGNPFNLTSTVTLGIVSAIGRHTGERISYQNFIQTDAAINPGNSGGALVNIDGALIGINSMIYTQSGGYMGIGFAIPINMAKRIMEDLIYRGKVSRGWLGVNIQDLTPAAGEAMGLGDQKGILVGDVFKGQPAEKAGIRRGDVITKINGKAVTNANDLRNEVANVAPGSSVPIEVIRNKKAMSISVKITERDEDKINKLASGGAEGKTEGDEGNASAEMLGITVGPLTSEVRNQLDLSADLTGVVVMELQPTAQAAQEGMQQYDVIREINQQPVNSVKEFKDAMKGLKSGSSVLFLLERKGGTFYLAFKIKK